MANNKQRKVGKLSNDERDFINKNMGELTPEELAIKLNRNVETIQKHIESLIDDKNFVTQRLESQDAFNDLRKKPFWPELKLKFTDKELEQYIYHWTKYIDQFNGDVTHAEECQICQAIEVNILMARVLIDKQKCERQLDALDVELRAACNRDSEDYDEDELKEHQRYIQELINQTNSIRSAQSNKTKEYNDLLEKSNTLAKSLKTTRDQRFKEIQERKVTFFGMLKQFDDMQERLRLSREAELIALATKKSIKDLGEYHNFADGEVDQPILNSETIKDDHGE